MRLTVIGCSPAVPNPGGAHSGYLVESDGARLLLDCGPGVLARLRQLESLPVDAIAITHFHLDHWGDLVPWAWMAMADGGSAGRTELWVPPGGRGDLESFAAAFGTPGMFAAAFDLREFAPGTAFHAAGLELGAERMEHFGKPAYGLRVRGPDGRVLAYSGDCAPCPGLMALAADAELLLCEATLAQPGDDGDPRGHLSADEALDVASGRLVLTHRPDELPTPPGTTRAVDGAAFEV